MRGVAPLSKLPYTLDTITGGLERLKNPPESPFTKGEFSECSAKGSGGIGAGVTFLTYGARPRAIESGCPADTHRILLYLW